MTNFPYAIQCPKCGFILSRCDTSGVYTIQCINTCGFKGAVETVDATPSDDHLFRTVWGTPDNLEDALGRIAELEAERDRWQYRLFQERQAHRSLKWLASSFAINPAIPFEFRAMLRKQLGEPPLMQPPVKRRRRWFR